MNSVQLDFVPLEPSYHHEYLDVANFKVGENGGKICKGRNFIKVLVCSPGGSAGVSSSLLPHKNPLENCHIVDRSSKDVECNRGSAGVPKVSLNKSHRTEIGASVQKCICQQQKGGSCCSCPSGSSPSAISAIAPVQEPIHVVIDKEAAIDVNIVGLQVLETPIVIANDPRGAAADELSCKEFSNDRDKKGYAIRCQRSEKQCSGSSKSITARGTTNAQFTDNCHFVQLEQPYPCKFAETSPAHSDTASTSTATMARHDRRRRLNSLSSTRKKLLNQRRTSSTYWQDRSLKLKKRFVSSTPPAQIIRCAICRQSVLKTSIMFSSSLPPKQHGRTTMVLCEFCYYERSRFRGPTTAGCKKTTTTAAHKKIHVEGRVQQQQRSNITSLVERRFLWKSSCSWRRHKCPVCQKHFYHPVNNKSSDGQHSVTRRQRDRTSVSAAAPTSTSVGPTDFGAANGASVGGGALAVQVNNFELEQEPKDAAEPPHELLDGLEMKAKSCKHLSRSHRSRGEYLMPSTSFDDCTCCPSTVALENFPPPPPRRSSVPPCNSSSLSLLAAASPSDPHNSTAEITLVPATSPPLLLATRPASSSLIVSSTTTASSPRSHHHHHNVHRSTLGCSSSGAAAAETAVITLVSKDDNFIRSHHHHHQPRRLLSSAPSTLLNNKTSSDRRHHHHCPYHRPGLLRKSAGGLVLNKDGTLLHPITHIIPPSSPAGSQIEISRAITNYWGHHHNLLKGSTSCAAETNIKDGVISLIASQSSDDSRSGGGDTITHVTIMVGQLQHQPALKSEIRPLTY